MATYDILFLGGGPAGYVGALRAAQLGLTVGVIEREARNQGLQLLGVDGPGHVGRWIR